MNSRRPTANTEASKEAFVWIARLTERERSTLIATFAGWMLDGLDVMAYSFVIPTLLVAWQMTRGQAGMLGTSALLI
jgi:hypothetical protein